MIKDYESLKAATVKDMQETYRQKTADGTISAETLLKNWKEGTPADIYGAFLQAEGITEPRAAVGIEQYLQIGIPLYPCNPEGRPIVKIYTAGHEIIRDNQIKDIDHLQEMKRRNVSRFSFIPMHSRLLILDLDNNCNEHANKTNGIDNFKNWISSLELNATLKEYFKDFPSNFPCYVETPHNGLHLYFNDAYVTESIKRSLDTQKYNALNIEIKYNTQCTAGGSIRNGKEYTLHGNIKNAPRIPPAMLDAMMKGRQKSRPVISADRKQNGQKWNETPEGIIQKAMELYGGYGPHDFSYKTAVLFHKAGFSKSIATDYIKQTPQHMDRKDKADTETAINSIYN